MPDVNLPVSIPLAAAYRNWLSMFNAYGNTYGNQTGLINVMLGTSTNPAVEQQVVSDVGSYGKQLGRIGDVVAVLLRHLPHDVKLSAEDQRAVTDLKSMLNEIANIKEQHGARHVLRP
nr:hypothetical protein [uncultured Lichenicoccus sp.]